MTEQDNNPTEGQATPSTERGASPPPETPSKDARMWAMFCHLGFIPVPCLPFLVPLILWLVKREDSPFIAESGKEAVNFQITVTIALVCAGILNFIPVVGCAAVFLAPAILVADIVLAVMASLKVNEGVAYRYPVCLRPIK
jgi:hypothetical protein